MANNPIIWATVAAGDFSAYYRRCARIVAELAGALRKLHDMGYVFVDLNPHNVLIGADDSVRLIDFELAAPPGELVTPVGAPGFSPSRRWPVTTWCVTTSTVSPRLPWP